MDVYRYKIFGYKRFGDKMIIKRELPKTVEATIKELKERFESIKSRASKLRKASKDTSDIDPLILNILPKIKMIEATFEQSDIDKARKALDYLDHETEKIEKDYVPSRVVEIIQEAYNAYWDGKLDLVEERYNFIKNLYDTSDNPELKKLVYLACIDLYKKLTEPPVNKTDKTADAASSGVVDKTTIETNKINKTNETNGANGSIEKTASSNH